LAGFSGHGEMPQSKTASPKKVKVKTDKHIGHAKPKVDAPPTNKLTSPKGEQEKPIGLTVRIEINLPADGDQETYDRIFRSIKENLLNG
jgi:hypothetical protein